MKIVVLVKQVPDTWQERSLDMETGMLVRDGAAEPVPDEINERVMEVALQHRDGGADAEIVALTMGPEDATKTLRKMLAMGADAAVHVCDEALAWSDAVQTARVLAAAVEREGADLVLAGNLSTDGSSGVVPAMVAELLDRPVLPHAEDVAIGDAEVSGDDDVAHGIRPGSAALWAAGENHLTRTRHGLTALIVEADSLTALTDLAPVQ